MRQARSSDRRRTVPRLRVILGETGEALVLRLHLGIGGVLAGFTKNAYDHRLNERHPGHAVAHRATQVKVHKGTERTRDEVECSSR
jgi:hypothetical protein